MDTSLTILVAATALVLIAVAVWFALQKRPRTHLRGRFGDEYERVVDVRDDRRAAEAELREREARRDELDIRELDPATQHTYADRWRLVNPGAGPAPSS